LRKISSGEGVRKAGDMEDKDKTADDTSGQKQKGDADASEEVAVGEQGICVPLEEVPPSPFTIEELRDIADRAAHIADQGARREEGWMPVSGYCDLATAAKFLEMWKRENQVVELEKCVIDGCLNPAYAPIDVTISHEKDGKGYTIQLGNNVRACKPCIKSYGLTIKDCVAY
jgi:hypothetical protein